MCRILFFQFWHFPSNCLVTLFNPPSFRFSKSRLKVECDFFGDFQTLCISFYGCKEILIRTSFLFQICSTKDGLPLANIWDVNHWIALRRQERFAEMFGQENTSKLKSSSTQSSEPLTHPGLSILNKAAKRVGFK